MEVEVNRGLFTDFLCYMEVNRMFGFTQSNIITLALISAQTLQSKHISNQAKQFTNQTKHITKQGKHITNQAYLCEVFPGKGLVKR